MAAATVAPPLELRIEDVKRSASRLRDREPLLLADVLEAAIAGGPPGDLADWLPAAWALAQHVPGSPLVHLVALALNRPEAVDWQVMRRELAEVRELLAGGADEAAPELAPTTAEALLTEDLPPREDVLGSVLPSGGLGLLAGAPKSGKTILALGLALAVCRGERFLDFATRQGPVLVLSGEGGPQLLKERLGKMAGNDRRGLDRLHLWWPEKRNLRLDKDEDRAALVQACKKREIGLLIVDPLVRHHSQDENSTRDMAALMACLAEVRQRAETAILLVHHTRKGGRDSKTGSAQEARGSSVLHGEVDAALVLERRRATGDFLLHSELRWAAEPGPLLLALDEQTLRFTVTGRVKPRARRVPEEEALRCLRQAGEVTSKAFGELLGVGQRTAQGYLAQLRTQGLAECRPGAGRGAPQLWSAAAGVGVGDEDDSDDLPF